jgi:hypothetical protein
MKHVSFRIIALCILLPPICYGFTIQGLEYYLVRKYTRDVEQVCVGDTTRLLQGGIRLKDAIRANIDRYLQYQKFLSWGVKAMVWVTTGHRIILYPALVEETGPPLISNEAPEIASENYSLLQSGLTATVDVKVEFGRLLPNVILGAYIFIAILSIYGVYRTGILKTNQEEAQINEKIERLLRQEQDFFNRLAALREERERVSAERDRLEKTLEAEKRKAGSNEAGLFGEIVGLDEQLTRNLRLQEQQQAEIKTLNDKISRFEKELKIHAPKRREVDMLAKRFGALYKNISVHERAVEGFAGLTEEMKIRGEEIIHRLNEAPDLVPIKRKVFSPKGREAVWEVLFSYNGRLYFRKSRDKRIEVIAVGNKNTQTHDLEFIDRISRKP